MSFQVLRERQSSRRTEPSDEDGTRGSRLVGLAIVAVGAVLLADAVARRLESRGPSTAVDGVRRRRGRSTPRGRDRSDERDGNEPVDGDRLNVDVTDEHRSSEAIDERATEDVQEEPATPGELALAEELREDDREE